jgi:hypothetical protein
VVGWFPFGCCLVSCVFGAAGVIFFLCSYVVSGVLFLAAQVVRKLLVKGVCVPWFVVLLVF